MTREQQTKRYKIGATATNAVFLLILLYITYTFFTKSDFTAVKGTWDYNHQVEYAQITLKFILVVSGIYALIYHTMWANHYGRNTIFDLIPQDGGSSSKGSGSYDTQQDDEYWEWMHNK